MMSDDAEKVKRERASAKGLFTKACNRLSKAIDTESETDLIDAKFENLKIRWSEVQIKHDTYNFALGTDLNEEEENTWIDELEEKFEFLEKAKFDYVRERKQKYEKECQSNKREVADTLNHEKIIAECRKKKNIRDMHGKVFSQEIKALQELIIADRDGSMKIQIDEAMKDVRLQLERCRESHMCYLEASNVEIEDDRWIEILYEERSNINRRVADHMQTVVRNREGKMKLEKMKLPNFNGELRSYAKFKSDFNKYVMPTIKYSESSSFVLRSCLNEKVKDIVINVEDKIEEIWKRLDEKYGDPSKLADLVINDVRKLRYVREGDIKGFLILVEVVEKGYRDLAMLDLENEISNTGTVSVVEERLPRDIRREWSKKVNEDGSKVDPRNKFPALLQFLREQRKIVEYENSEIRRSSEVFKSKVYHFDENRLYDESDQQVFQMNNYIHKCLVHKEIFTHTTQDCFNFKGMDVKTRMQVVKEARGCWCCLKPGHRAIDCRFRKVCENAGCGRYHHILLHYDSEAEKPILSLNSKFEKLSEMCLLPLMKIKSKGININVLWDTGATISLITNEAAKGLLLKKGSKRTLTVVKVGGNMEEISSYVYNLPLIDENDKITYIQVYGVEKISSNINEIDISLMKSCFNMKNDEKLCNSHGTVDVLIGINYASIQPQMEKSVGNLVMYRNKFGRCIAGLFEEGAEERLNLVNLCILNKRKPLVEDFFSVEQMGVSCVPMCGNCRCGRCPIGGKDFTIKEERELKLIENGLIFRDDHWEAHYPWIKDPYLLPNNREIVLKMLKSTERRLLKDPDKSKQYNEQIEDMVIRNVARKLTNEELIQYKGPVYYLAHHAVLKEESKSTPCRVVFNSSAKMFGQVINEYWAKGPNLLTSLLGILIRFREERFAIIGDIKKMFHAIKISEVDQNTHRFLWRNLNIDREADDYMMLSVSFGDRPSAGIAITALRKTAELGADEFPDASKVLKENVYMDDIIDSFNSYSKAQMIVSDINKILERGNFEVKKWTVINEEVLDKDEQRVYFDINETSIDSTVLIDNDVKESRESSLYNKDGENNIYKVLGLDWEYERDCFIFSVEGESILKHGKNKLHDIAVEYERCILTKRMILSAVNGIYDPLGLLTPIVIKAKIMLKELWCEKVEWDEPVSIERLKEWNKFFESMAMLKGLSFRRCIKFSECTGDPIMIIFCDASEQAFGACCYLRWKTKGGTFKAQLMAAKSRVSPAKVQSIVRLEICGAVLGKRLAQCIQRETRYRIERRYFIVDSEVVRSMIKKQSYGFNTFVAVRIGEIQEFTDANEWFWVESKLNVADYITRGKEIHEIKEGSIWQEGPRFLQDEENSWPIKGSVTEDIPEEKIEKFVYQLKVESNLSSEIDPTRFGSYLKLIRTTARVLSVFRNKISLKNILQEPSSEEFSIAEKSWIKESQRSMYSGIEAGRYRRLNPRLNDDGIYIVSGRMEYWFEYTYNTKGLILLPHNHRLSLLYAIYIHQKSHLGVSTVVSKIRRRFWIVKLPKIVRKIRLNCVKCKKLDKVLQKQIMAPLPLERQIPYPPFYNTSLDLFGPLMIKGEVNKRTKGKVFGVIFTCMYTRAVYCDVAQNYSTDAFLLVLRRFVAIHGYPKKMYSDPGSQLVSASKELKKLDVQTMMNDSEELKQFGVVEGIEWKFSTADAPWQNGTAESLIKAVKRGIMVAVGDQVISFSELQTVLFEVFNIVNERPIGVHPKHPDDGTYLCPNDMLLGRSSNKVPAGPFKQCSNLKRLTFIEALADGFWRKWSRDYFSSLLVRTKWHTSKRNLKVDDIVLIHDAKSLRGNWKLGRICQVYPGNDGFVRNVDITYKSNQDNNRKETVRRAIQKLVLIQPADEPIE